MKNIFYILISLIVIGCNGQSGKAENISPAEFAEKSKLDVQILDVRTPEEYLPQHIKNAQNINLKSADFEQQASKLDKSKPILVYCLSGGRSAKAVEKLHSMGFSEVYNLDGGIVKWNAEKMPTESAAEKSSGMSMAEFGDLLKSDKKVLIDFYAEWCAPCKKMAPYLAKMELEMKDQLVIVRIDADKNPQLLDQLKVDGLPTLLLYENQEQIWRNTGYITEENLKKQL